ncbi:MAG: hypothetical protein ABR968_00380 [Bacteroidales bacterium]|jgi:chromosome segregation ATPase
MKKTIFTLAISMLMSGTMFTACKSSAKKVNDAKDKVEIANQELSQAIKDSIQQFKNESEDKINANAKSLADFKARIANEKADIKIKYEKKLADLDQKNSDLRKKLDDYKEEGKEKWEAFKADFSNNMEELSKSLKDFTYKNAR